MIKIQTDGYPFFGSEESLLSCKSFLIKMNVHMCAIIYVVTFKNTTRWWKKSKIFMGILAKLRLPGSYPAKAGDGRAQGGSLHPPEGVF